MATRPAVVALAAVAAAAAVVVAEAAQVQLEADVATAMAAAMAYVLEREDLVDRDFMARCTRGYAPYQSYVLGATDGTPKTPEWAAAISGASNPSRIVT